MKLFRHSIDILLVALAAVGGYLALLSSQERTKIQAEIARIEAKVGRFENIEPDKINILALDTGKPLEFAWRIYLPPNYPLRLKHFTSKSGNSGSYSTSASALEFIARAQISEQDGQIKCMSRFASSAVTLHMRPPKEVSQAGLMAHIKDFLIHQVGQNKMATLGVEEEFDLLEVKLPSVATQDSQTSNSPEALFRIQFSKSYP